jgi:hypothetical protein
MNVPRGLNDSWRRLHSWGEDTALAPQERKDNAE